MADYQDRHYTAAWVTLLLAGAAIEQHALRYRPNERATLSANTWTVLGPRHSPRWFLGVCGWAVLSKHILFHPRPQVLTPR